MSTLEIATRDSGLDVLDETAADTLGTVMAGTLLRAGDEGYDRARRVWNGMVDRRPALIARCGDTVDVVDSLAFAREHDLVTAVRGGGHNVAGHASCDGGLVVDLSCMNAVHVDPERRTARVQGGAIWADLDRATQLFGLATPGGVVSTTGVAGLTLGGGLGWLRRKYGLSCDNLLSADVVTADGRLCTARPEGEHADLFWGLQGGGGNFGVVTSFEYRLHEVGPEVMFAGTMYEVEHAGSVLRSWRDFMEGAPEEVSSQAVFWSVPAVEAFPEETHGRPVVVVVAMHCGAPEVGEQILRPLRELAAPLIDLSGVMPYVEVQQLYDPFLPAQDLSYYWKSLRLDRFDDEVIDALVAHASTRPSPHTLMPVWHHGGAMQRIAPDATAFGDRSAPFLLSLDATWEDPADTEENVAWTRAVWDDMQRFSDGGLYLNFAGTEADDDLVRSAYGPNLDRLRQIKAKYDPDNTFFLNENIRPDPALP